MDGDQFGSDFVAINRTRRLALLDRSGMNRFASSRSTNILPYLAEKFGKFLPEDTAKHRSLKLALFGKLGSTDAKADTSSTTQEKISMPLTVSLWKQSIVEHSTKS